MRNPLKFGRFFRIRMRIHYTWILAIILITLAVSTQFSTEHYSLSSRIMFGGAASVLFFFAILIREFLLSLIAINKGIAVESVTIFAFGGLMQVDQETTTPAHELLLAVAGMLCNLIIAGILFIAYTVLKQTGQMVTDVLLQWLAFLCFMLTLFHIIPGFPLDGGRILRAILWKILHDSRRATLAASWTGWGIGLILTVGGILLLILTLERFTGVFLIAIGLILQNAATHGRRQANRTIMQLPANTS